MIITEDMRQEFMKVSTMMMCKRARERNDFVTKTMLDIAKGRDFTPQVYLEWINWLLNERKVSINTTVCYRDKARAFFNWAQSMGYCDKSPCVRIRNLIMTPVERVPITVDEYIRLQQYTQYKPRLHYMYYMIVVAWNTGMRCKDIALLQWDSINLLTRAIKFKPFKTIRHNRVVEVPIADELYWFLNELKLKTGPSIYACPETARRMLKSMGGKGVFDTPFRSVCSQVGIVGKSMHCFRHSFITRLLNAGVSPAIVATMAGHNLEEVMTYQHISLESKTKAIQAI